MIKYKCRAKKPRNMSSERPYLECVEVELMTDDPPDETAVEKLIEMTAEEFDLTLFSVVTHKFEPHGVTALAVIGESHIAVHTWPENAFTHLQIFSCKELPGIESIRQFFKQSGFEVIRVFRQIQS